MVKSFSQFINENYEEDQQFLEKLKSSLIKMVRQFREQENEYTEFSGISFDEPYSFNLILFLKKDSSPDFKTDDRFKNLPWEEINFNEKGYAIDATSRISEDPNIKSIISIYLILDPRKEPHVYTKLSYRLLDILTHETNHLGQMGEDETPYNANPSYPKDRESAKTNFRYFLLPDEIESMVEGMYVSSKEQQRSLDEIFHEYLRPYIISKYISHDEYSKVMQVWVKYALQRYPDADFSKKVEKIVNSI